jgi:hypothetical protein
MGLSRMSSIGRRDGPRNTWSGMDINWAAFAPIIVLAVAFVGYCLFDLSRNQPRLLPRWAWALICVVSVPLGGVVYLLVGRESGNSP